MKLILAVVQSKDVEACVDALVGAGHVCTRLASFGGFLEQGNATLLTAVDDREVEATLGLLSRKARQRNQSLRAVAPGAGANEGGGAPRMDVEVGGATVFVLDVERMEKL